MAPLPTRFCIKITGFKPSRIREWRAAVVSEARTIGLFALARSVSKAALRLGGVDKTRWRRRARACRACPVFDWKTRKCRVAGRALGCGCWMPAKSLVGDRAAACWRIGLGDDVPAFD